MSVSLKNMKLLADFICEREYGGDDSKSYYFQAEHDVIYTNLSLDTYPEDSEDGKFLSDLGLTADSYNDVWIIYV